MVGKKALVYTLLVVLFSGVAGIVTAETVYYVEEGKSITLSFTNPTNETIQIQVKNLSYPKQTVPIWLSMTSIPPQQTVDVILHFYVVNDGVSAGTYAIAVYTPYQSYLVYLKKTSGETQQADSTEWVRIYQELQAIRTETQQLYQLWESRYNELYAQVQQLKAQDTTDDKKIAELEREIKDLNTDLNDLKKLIEQQNKIILDMQKIVQSNDKKVATFENTIKNYEKTLANYDKQISVINAQLKSIDVERYKQLEQTVKQLETKVAKMEQAVADAKSLAMSASSSSGTLSSQIRDLESKYKFLLIGAFAGVVALAMIFTNGNFKFGNNKRNGGLPRKNYSERERYAVPQGVPVREVAKEIKREQRILQQTGDTVTLTKDELAALLESAAERASFETLMKLAEVAEEEEENKGGEAKGKGGKK